MRTRLLAVALLGLLGVAAPARAELVFFDTGRSMSVKSHRVDGDSLVIALRSGGEVTFDRSLVTRIEPDEVPYPEPEVTGGRARAAGRRTLDSAARRARRLTAR